MSALFECGIQASGSIQSSGSMLHSISRALVCVVIIAPLMNRESWLCTLSKVGTFVCVTELSQAH